MQLASCVATYSHVQLRQQSGEPITDNWGTRGCLTWLVNQPQQKQTEQPLALIYTWTVSGLMRLLNGDKRWVLKWCTYKTPFDKSGHIYNWTEQMHLLVYYSTVCAHNYVCKQQLCNYVEIYI